MDGNTTAAGLFLLGNRISWNKLLVGGSWPSFYSPSILYLTKRENLSEFTLVAAGLPNRSLIVKGHFSQT